MEQGVVPGVQMALIRDGAIAWAGAFGVANIGTKVPLTDASVFEAASLSKPVFAYAVLKLVDAGQLDLDRPLASYLPGGYDVRDDARLGQITARHVLSHVSGFPNWRGSRPLRIYFDPGQRFSYSGEGFVYLAAVVERITGLSLEAFLQRQVFEPLGMASSSFVWQARYESLKVHSHSLLGEVAGRGTPWRANAAATLHTTARDYARFVMAAASGAGLRPETARQMTSPQSRPDEVGTDTALASPAGRPASGLAWGLGWGLEQDGDRWAMWHWGDNGPTKAFVIVSADRRVGLVMFANSQSGLTIVPELIGDVMAGPRPSFAWLKLQTRVPAFGPFVRTLQGAGAERALEEYRAARAADTWFVAIGEDTMNSIGYVLLGGKRTKDAVAVFAQNVADHPQSWNAHDSLGEALAADGRTEDAIKAYERSVALNPGNTGGVEALARLRAGR